MKKLIPLSQCTVSCWLNTIINSCLDSKKIVTNCCVNFCCWAKAFVFRVYIHAPDWSKWASKACLYLFLQPLSPCWITMWVTPESQKLLPPRRWQKTTNSWTPSFRLPLWRYLEINLAVPHKGPYLLQLKGELIGNSCNIHIT